MKKLFYVSSTGNALVTPLVAFASYLDEKLGVQARIDSDLQECEAAHVLLRSSLQMFLNSANRYISIVQDNAWQIKESDLIPEGIDEIWAARDAKSKQAEAELEVLVSGVLNHFYVFQQHLLEFTRQLQTLHGVLVVQTMVGKDWEEKKWEKLLRRHLGEMYDPKPDSSRLANYLKIMELRRQRVHEFHLYVHAIDDGEWSVCFTHSRQPWKDYADPILTNRDLENAWNELNDFLAWYLQVCESILGPREE
ncbi:MAG: hypothetical protein IH944_12265 [Armatimonadetes bacterium]|nr:hypothetical protein [Armatimonadota bacterium]